MGHIQSCHRVDLNIHIDRFDTFHDFYDSKSYFAIRNMAKQIDILYAQRRLYEIWRRRKRLRILQTLTFLLEIQYTEVIFDDILDNIGLSIDDKYDMLRIVVKYGDAKMQAKIVRLLQQLPDKYSLIEPSAMGLIHTDIIPLVRSLRDYDKILLREYLEAGGEKNVSKDSIRRLAVINDPNLDGIYEIVSMQWIMGISGIICDYIYPGLDDILHL